MTRLAGSGRKRVRRAGTGPVGRLNRMAKAQIIEFAVFGDSHVGYGNSLSMFGSLLPKAAGSGNKRFFIFGGDNTQAGADHGNHAGTYYKDFKDTVTGTLGSIPYKASIGNWEASTRPLFTQYLGAVAGQMNFPGTKGRVKYVWLDCALGIFTPASINLLRKLDDSHYYIIDFHWPLKVQGITVEPSHVLSAAETTRFFSSIPVKARDKVLAIFTHHGHKFYRKLANIHPDYPRTKFFVCGCSGDYKCKPNDRGYYNATLTGSGTGYRVDAIIAR
ncbi:metallophosphoesterase [Paenibacillus sp. MMS20-IR301]|uniref:metallophosphoesterase n=1 Tax=Paenibacillus sp. MMS20-IR301 TaxID=2895946 RepID=UPI0028E456C8|nr:metallophosphoesterase [Paenibacillus sp. MMS20-IR301]WNS46798.1 metallophosphoesterase [Paenibacillus sp. MMS20-IR301]